MSAPRQPVTPEESAAILRLHHVEGWPVGTIAEHFGRHHDTVERVLAHGGLPIVKHTTRSRRVDPYIPFIEETLARYPRLRASRLWTMVRARGYSGSKSGFRAIISRLRPRRHAEAYLRRAVLPGQEAQVDWAHFGKLTVGRAERELFAFVMVLAYSRKRLTYFAMRAAMPSFLRGHVERSSLRRGSARTWAISNRLAIGPRSLGSGLETRTIRATTVPLRSVLEPPAFVLETTSSESRLVTPRVSSSELVEGRTEEEETLLDLASRCTDVGRRCAETEGSSARAERGGAELAIGTSEAKASSATARAQGTEADVTLFWVLRADRRSSAP